MTASLHCLCCCSFFPLTLCQTEGDSKTTPLPTSCLPLKIPVTLGYLSSPICLLCHKALATWTFWRVLKQRVSPFQSLGLCIGFAKKFVQIFPYNPINFMANLTLALSSTRNVLSLDKHISDYFSFRCQLKCHFLSGEYQPSTLL